MYTASGGYMLDGSSFTQKKLTVRKFGSIPMFQLIVFLSLFILSFVFGAVMHANATTEVTTTAQTESNSLYETYIVDSGQSLWSIARVYTPSHMDIRDYVYELQLLNQLDSSVLFQGQRLLLPSI